MSVRKQSILIIAVALVITAIFIYEGLKNFQMGYTEHSYTINDQDFTYDLLHPDDHFDLPPDLREISGLSWIGNEIMACIQDEDGIVFFVNLESRTIEKEVKFGEYGDYEGLTHYGPTYYVLRNDGDIFTFEEGQETDRIETGLKKANNAEGLVYDPVDQSLLIACKDRPGLEEKLAGRAIYKLPLKTKNDGSVDLKWLISPDDYEQLLLDRELDPLIHRAFKPSGLALHPTTGNVYVISSTGRLLLVMDNQGMLLTAVPLRNNLLRQPEGITFDDDGTLYIASEGKGEKGYILKFESASSL